MAENGYSGSKLRETSKKEFGQKLRDHLGDTKTLGKTSALHVALSRLDLAEVPEIRALTPSDAADEMDSVDPVRSAHKAPSRSCSQRSQMSAVSTSLTMGPIQEDQAIETPPPHALPQSPQSHGRCHSEPANGHKISITKMTRSGTGHRSENEELAALDEQAFCEWVTKCVSKGAPSKTVRIMVHRIEQNGFSGKKMMKYLCSGQEALEDFIQSKLHCNEIYLLQYLADKMMNDHQNNKEPFENHSASEFAQYVEAQSHCLPADAFRRQHIDGKVYCSKDSKGLYAFFRSECGFKAGTARPLMANIDKYPKQPSFSRTDHRRVHTLDWLGIHGSPPQTDEVHDDRSDVSETRELSMSYSVNMLRHQQSQKSPEELFADHALKIYERENERHWRRIGERLNKLGIEKLLCHMTALRIHGIHDHDDEKTSGSVLDEKYFTKQAKLVYKIDEDRFYVELYKDVMNEALDFDKGFDRKHARDWIVRYELKKLHHVMMERHISKKRFMAEMRNEDVFCRQYMGFLPRKRRKVLFKKLKKDINKGKLNGNGYDRHCANL